MEPHSPQLDLSILPVALVKLDYLSISTIAQLGVGLLAPNSTWKTYVYSRRDCGTVPRAPHIIPWVGNIKPLLIEPVSWLWEMHEKL
ncbi:hypothetical protein OPQ81_011801 [Rhizoctonia solani]|nr:hypothetical protein OPQ81_011801 [Rhizoctonia solani]